jgi:hypothetical protein
MMGEPAAILAVSPFAQKIEHLRMGKGNNKGGKSGSTGNQDTFRGFPRDELSRTLGLGHLFDALLVFPFASSTNSDGCKV